MKRIIKETRRCEYVEWMLPNDTAPTSENRVSNYVGGDLRGISEFCNDMLDFDGIESITLITRSGGEGSEIGGLFPHEACWILEDRLNSIREIAYACGKDADTVVVGYCLDQFRLRQQHLYYYPEEDPPIKDTRARTWVGEFHG